MSASTPTAHPVESARHPADLTSHPAADLVPVMPENEFAAFRADIAERGLLVPIEINAAGAVLDGRQRLRAARELGLETVAVKVIEVEDEPEYMLRAAVLRRQLNEAQRAALAVSLVKYRELQAVGKQRQQANLRQNRTDELATSRQDS